MDNDQRIAEIKARCNMATPGPWGTPEKPIIPLLDMPYNAGFIAHAREDMPFLLSQLAAKDAEIERLREAQRWIPMGERTPGERFEDKGLYRVKADYSERSSTPCEKIAYWNGVVWIEPTWFDWPQNNRLNPQPTHWMPLPAAPEEGTTE